MAILVAATFTDLFDADDVETLIVVSFIILYLNIRYLILIQWYKSYTVRYIFGKRDLCNKSCKNKGKCDLRNKGIKDKKDADLRTSCESWNEKDQGFVFKKEDKDSGGIEN